MYLKTFFVLTVIALVKSDCDGANECLSDPYKNKVSDKVDSEHKLNINNHENDSSDDSNKPPELIQFSNNLDKTLSKVFSDVSSLVEDELKEVFGVKQDIHLYKNFDDNTQIHLKAYTLSDKLQHPLFNQPDVKLPEIARSNNITKLNDELSSLKVQVEKSIEKEIEDFILKVIETEALDWISKELDEVIPAKKETTLMPVTNSKTNTEPPKLTTLTTTTTQHTAFVSISTTPTTLSNIVTQNPVIISKVPDNSVPKIPSSIPASSLSSVEPTSLSSPVTTTKSYITTESPMATPKGSIIPISITTKTVPTSSSSVRSSSPQGPTVTTTESYVTTKMSSKSPMTTSSSSPRPSSPQGPTVTTTESYVTTKMSSKSPITTSLPSPRPSSPQSPTVTTTESYVTTKMSPKSHISTTTTMATEKSPSSMPLSTSKSSPSTISPLPNVITTAIKVNESSIRQSTTDTKNIPDGNKYSSTSEIPPVPMQTDTIFINATFEMDEDVDIETDPPNEEPVKKPGREGILNINLIKDNEILDEEYYDIPDDNSTDYPIIDYVEMYKDTTNENRVYKPTNVPEAVTFRAKSDIENYINNETVYTKNNETHNVTTT